VARRKACQTPSTQSPAGLLPPPAKLAPKPLPPFDPLASGTRARLSAEEQAVLNKKLLVLLLTTYNGYWREIDACVGLCYDTAFDPARDGVLHLTMHFAAKAAAKADAAYTGSREWPCGPPSQHTRLHQAARAGLDGRVAVLLAAGAAVNARDRTGRTALIIAATHKHTDCATALIAAPGCDVNSVGPDGEMPLLIATSHCSVGIAAALLKTPGIDVNVVCRWTGFSPLHWAAFNGHSYIAARLLAVPGINVNARRERDGATPLKTASRCFALKEVSRLIIAAGGHE
jgi:ankyrin repeat protein